MFFSLLGDDFRLFLFGAFLRSLGTLFSALLTFDSLSSLYYPGDGRGGYRDQHLPGICEKLNSGEINIPGVNRISDLELGDIDFDEVHHVGRKTCNRNLSLHELEDSPHGLDTERGTLEVQRDIDVDLPGQGYLPEIDMEQLTLDRIFLDLRGDIDSLKINDIDFEKSCICTTSKKTKKS